MISWMTWPEFDAWLAYQLGVETTSINWQMTFTFEDKGWIARCKKEGNRRLLAILNEEAILAWVAEKRLAGWQEEA